MFKKVQMRFFAIITSILLALFIAVLASINLIMEAVMQRQSKVVLKQIATSIEYDENTATFTYSPEPFEDKKPPSDESSAPPPVEDKNDAPELSEPSTDAPDATELPTEETRQPDEPTSDSSQMQTETPPETTSPPVEEPMVTTVPQNIPTENHTTTITQDTTQNSEQNTMPLQTTPEFQPERPPVPPHDDEQRPPNYDEDYPPYPWPEQERDDNNCYDDYHCNEYPPTYENYWQYWHNNDSYHREYEQSDDYYDYDENTQQQGFSEDDDALPELTQLAGLPESPLEGYTIINSVPYIAVSENAARKSQIAPVPKSLGTIDFFVLMADNDGKLMASLNNEVVNSSDAQKYINAILGDGAASGMLNNYQFCQMPKENGTVMVFTDKSAEIDMLDRLNQTTIIIGIISFIVLSILAFFFSKKSIEPIKVAFEKQKQFISDASHELKTPLTIISANADVLSDEIGENKWLDYIKSQAERMNVLVNDLLNLTRLENNTADFVAANFNLSKAIENTALPFECQAFETQKNFVIDVHEGLFVNGSERHIKQMAAIFIDNALKYSNPEGTVRVTLAPHGDKAMLSVFNTGSGIKDSEKDKIFERFYRSDTSRARTTGGYGLGLAIAKSIADKHKFKLSINNVEGESIEFIVIM